MNRAFSATCWLCVGVVIVFVFVGGCVCLVFDWLL